MKTYRDLIALIVAGVLFFGGFALGTGIDQNPVQAIPALIMLGACTILVLSTDRKRSRSARSEELRVKSEKSIRKAQAA